jgi:hypothetical protein
MRANRRSKLSRLLTQSQGKARKRKSKKLARKCASAYNCVKGAHMTTQYVRTSVHLPIEEYRKLKAYTSFAGIHLKDYLYNCVHDHTPHVPNAETLAAMKATNDYLEAKHRGEEYKPIDPDDEMIVCENYEDFLNKTGLRDLK